MGRNITFLVPSVVSRPDLPEPCSRARAELALNGTCDLLIGSCCVIRQNNTEWLQELITSITITPLHSSMRAVEGLQSMRSQTQT